jgi:RIO kinase 1
MTDKSYLHELFEDLDGYDQLPAIRNRHTRGMRLERKRNRKSLPSHSNQRARSDITDLAETSDTFDFTYNASHHERKWITDSLGGFYDGQWLVDVLRLLKGGKEASVYLCTVNPAVKLASNHIAAKVYRPRQFRNLKNDHLYREGRIELDQDGIQIIDDRTLHAIHKRTEYGRRAMHTSWIEHEYQTMRTLSTAGVDIPYPHARGDNAILMEYIGDSHVAAPTLNTIKLDAREAQSLFNRLLQNLDLMLANQRVHADFSAYNILYWEGEIKIIDFPQAINPHENHNSYWIFQRDIQRLCEYFQHQGLQLKPKQIADELWTAHGLAIQHKPNPAYLDDQNDDDIFCWNQVEGT